MPDIKVLTFQQIKQQNQQQKQQQSLNSSLRKTQIKSTSMKQSMIEPNGGASSLGSDTDRSGGSSSNQTVDTAELVGERTKMCGTLFERKPVINQEIFDEFFRREPCPYSILFLFLIHH